MIRFLLAAAAILVAFQADPLQAAEQRQRVVLEADVQMLSALNYGEILRQAVAKGWRYTPEQIESGYRRHFEEMKLRFIDCGYTILVGETGA
jgi:hypothetical protein